jgi:ankyrin repeat protein
VRLLLKKGPEVEAKDTDGETVLYWAARNGRSAVVRLPLEKGPRLEAKTNVGHQFTGHPTLSDTYLV